MKLSQNDSHNVPFFRNRIISFWKKNFIVSEGLHNRSLGSHIFTNVSQIVSNILKGNHLI